MRQVNKPTHAIIVLVIGALALILLVWMHIPGAFPDLDARSPKYLVTIFIAIASALFMAVRGNKIIRENFGELGGRNLELTGRQALYVVVIMVLCGAYGAWVSS